MKSTRRHELQENILGQELGRIAGFIRAHSTALSWGLLVIAVLALAAALWYRHGKSAENQNENEFAAVVLMQGDVRPEDRIPRMKDLLARDKDKLRLAMTTYEIGREYLTKMITTPQEDKKLLGEQAAEYFRMVIEKYPTQYVIVAKAHIALGKVYENMGDFNAAAGEYQAMLAMSALSQGYPLTEFAAEARAAIGELKQPASFASTAPSTAPAASASAPATASEPTSTAAAATGEAQARPTATGSAPATAPAMPARATGTAEGK